MAIDHTLCLVNQMTGFFVYHIFVVQSCMFESESNFGLQNGDLCISILHPPVDDPQSGELPCERWNPTQNVRYFDVQVFLLY
jgi:hypothetical protein